MPNVRDKLTQPVSVPRWLFWLYLSSYAALVFIVGHWISGAIW